MAYYNLGFEYAHGLLVAQDERKAIGLLKKATEKGILEAYSELGLLYTYGDTVQPDDFARHLKASDLVAPVFSEDAGFEEAGAYGVERREGRAVVEQRRAALDLAARGHQLVELARFSL